VRLPEVGRPTPPVSVLDGGDEDHTTGRLLTVAELQRAMREVRAYGPTGPAPAPALVPAPVIAPGHESVPVRTVAPPAPVTVAEALVFTAQPAQAPGPFVLVLAAQAGSGASTVALALSDSAAGAGRGVHLVSGYGRSTCGLLAVPHLELGPVEQRWRRGRRGDLVLVDRADTDEPGSGWPQSPVPTGVLRVLDAPVGSRLAASPPMTVLLVCRATVPGLQRAEHALRRLEDQRLAALAAGRLSPGAPLARVLLAVVGPDRWAGPVSASVGLRVQRLQRDHRVTYVPLDRHLDLTGPSPDPLPKAVLKAGQVLLQHIDSDLADLAHLAASVDGRSQSWTTQPASFSPLNPEDRF